MGKQVGWRHTENKPVGLLKRNAEAIKREKRKLVNKKKIKTNKKKWFNQTKRRKKMNKYSCTKTNLITSHANLNPNYQ